MRHTDETVRMAAQGAQSISEVMKKLGLKPHGYAHFRFKQRLLRLGIYIKPLRTWNKEASINRVFVKDS